MNSDSELRQYLLDQEEKSQTRQILAWARLRDRLYANETKHHWSDGLWRNLIIGALGATAVFLLGSRLLVSSEATSDPLQRPGIVKVTLRTRPSAQESHVVFVSQEAPNVVTTTFYSPEAQADVIWVSNAGYVQE